MTASLRLLLALPIAAALAACASAPASRAAPPTPLVPLVTSSGLVIGTLSYHYVEVARAAAPAWVVHFERIDAPAAQDYAMVVEVDPATRSGVFTGALPAGVYTFREAASAERRYRVGTMHMPFEVQAGAVQDAGHYALNPMQ